MKIFRLILSKWKRQGKKLGKKIEDPDRDTGAEYKAEKAKERVVD